MAKSIRTETFLDDMEVKKANYLRLMAETAEWRERMPSRKPAVVRLNVRFNQDEL